MTFDAIQELVIFLIVTGRLCRVEYKQVAPRPAWEQDNFLSGVVRGEI